MGKEYEPTLSPLGPRSPLGPCEKRKESFVVNDQIVTDISEYASHE